MLLLFSLFRENKFEIFTCSAVLPNNCGHHDTLSTNNICPTDHDRCWTFQIEPCLQTFFHSIFVDFMRFTRNRTLIGHHTNGSKEKAICRNLHTIGQENHIPRHNLSPMNFLSLTIPQNLIIVATLGHFIKFIKLPLFLIVADRANHRAHNDSNHDRHTINPEHILLLACEIFHDHGHNSRNHQDDQKLITDGLFEYLE